jgi:antitoxin HicB
MRTYTIVLEPEESGGHFVTVPALPGCFTQGRTLEECQARAAEAIEAHIGLVADGDAVPEEFGTPQPAGRHGGRLKSSLCGPSPAVQSPTRDPPIGTDRFVLSERRSTRPTAATSGRSRKTPRGRRHLSSRTPQEAKTAPAAVPPDLRAGGAAAVKTRYSVAESR